MFFFVRSSSKVPYTDEVMLEKESNELNEEIRELLSLYHKTFDDDRVSESLFCKQLNVPTVTAH